MNWYAEVFKKYAQFSGRARRKEYWMFVLVHLLVSFAFGFFDAAIGASGFMAIVYGLAVSIPGTAVAIRRIHDTDRSGWWILFPFVNFVILTLEGTKGENRFGPDPKAPEMYSSTSAVADSFTASNDSNVAPAVHNYNLDDLDKLAALRDKGIITEQEFDAKKKQILDL